MRRFTALAILGMCGVASLALVPFEQLAPGMTMDPAMLRLLALIQPAVLTLAMVAVGCRAANKVRLAAPLVDALLSGGDARAVLRRQLPAAIVTGAAVAALLILYGLTAGRVVTSEMAGSPLAGFSLPITTKLLYGGITEELLTRWGLMSVFAWFAWRLGGKPERPGTATMVAAIILAALVFAGGHLPMLSLLAPAASAPIIATVVLANAVPGVLFGWLFWRRGIEAAIIAHALAHLLSHFVV